MARFRFRIHFLTKLYSLFGTDHFPAPGGQVQVSHKFVNTALLGVDYSPAPGGQGFDFLLSHCNISLIRNGPLSSPRLREVLTEPCIGRDNFLAPVVVLPFVDEVIPLSMYVCPRRLSAGKLGMGGTGETRS